MKDIFSLSSIVDWLREQPADGRYIWPDPNECLAACYLRSVTGVRHPCDDFGGKYVKVFDGAPSNWNYGYIGATLPWTFGAALARAEQVLAGYVPEPLDVALHEPLPSPGTRWWGLTSSDTNAP